MGEFYGDHDVDGKTAGAFNGVVVTPGAAALSKPARALYVGGTGNLNVTFQGGNTVLFTGVPAGAILPIRVTHVLSTSTTATLIVALY